jgi:hypothetical protein
MRLQEQRGIAELLRHRQQLVAVFPHPQHVAQRVYQATEVLILASR